MPRAHGGGSAPGARLRALGALPCGARWRSSSPVGLARARRPRQSPRSAQRTRAPSPSSGHTCFGRSPGGCSSCWAGPRASRRPSSIGRPVPVVLSVARHAATCSAPPSPVRTIRWVAELEGVPSAGGQVAYRVLHVTAPPSRACSGQVRSRPVTSGVRPSAARAATSRCNARSSRRSTPRTSIS